MDTIITSAQSFSPWEILAVICAITYLLLAVKEIVWCWLFAFISTLIYTVLFWNVSLLMDSALNVYYMAMAVFGWYQWTHGGANDSSNNQNTLPVRSLNARQHLWIITTIIVFSALSGYYLSEQTTAVWPYVDSFTTWASVVTTYLVTRKYLQNWLYWIVIDVVAIPLYIDRGLALTALLFVFYVFIAVFGYFKWKQHFNGQTAHVTS